jgi:GGDEF domain-containing protein
LPLLLLGGALVFLSTLAVPPAFPQAKVPDEPGVRLQPKDYSTSMRKAFQAMVQSSKETEIDERAANIIDVAVQNFVYPVTFIEKQNAFEGMSKVVSEFELALNDFPNAVKKYNAKNDKVREKFLERATEHLKEVLTNPRLIARVNGAEMLALVAKAGYEDAAEVLLEVIKDDKQSDAVRYWAYRGLYELFRQANREEPTLKNKAREAECILALGKAIDRKGPMAGPREVIEGARVLRREAVRALAATRYPVLADKDGKNVKGYPALMLLRLVAQPGSYQPPLRLDEQVEAAIGLTRLLTKGFPDYQPDYAAWHVGRFIVRFAEEYQRAREAKNDAMEPWKIHAARLLEGLEWMRADAAKNIKDKDVTKYLTELVNRAGAVLQPIEKGQTARAGDLSNWLNANPPKNPALFRGKPDTAIKAMEPEEKPADPKKDG